MHLPRLSLLLLVFLHLPAAAWAQGLKRPAPPGQVANPYAEPAGVLVGRALVGEEEADAPRFLVRVENTQIDMRMAGGVLEARIAQEFVNDTDTHIEAAYMLPLPSKAALMDMVVETPTRVLRSQLKETLVAEQEFAAAAAAGKRAALMSMARPNLYSLSVTNIAPGERIRVYAWFTLPVEYREGVYTVRFPLTTGEKYIPPLEPPSELDQPAVNGPRVEGARQDNRVTISLTIQDLPLSDVVAKTHDIVWEQAPNDASRVLLADGPIIPDRDFVVELRLRSLEEQEVSLVTHDDPEATYALFTLLPPSTTRNQTKNQAVDIVYVVDVSGSMAGTRQQQAEDGLLRALKYLGPDDSFNVISYDDSFNVLFGSNRVANRENIAAGEKFAKTMYTAGGTMMQPALAKAMELLKGSTRLPIIVLFTDGDVGNESTLLAMLEDIGRSRLFTFGIGMAPNEGLMNEMARVGRGQCRYITDDEEVSNAMAQFARAVAHPVMTDIQVAWLDADGTPVEANMFPEPLPDLFVGEPLQLVARLPLGYHGSVVVEGVVDGQTETFAYTVEQGGGKYTAVRHLFGSYYLRELLREYRSAPTDELKQHIIDASVGFQVMSPFTSRIAVEQEVIRKPDAPLHHAAVPNARPGDSGLGSAAGAVADNGDLYVMNAFTVNGEDEGYCSVENISGLGMGVGEVPVPISVINAEMIRDLQANDMRESLSYEAGVFTQDYTAETASASRYEKHVQVETAPTAFVRSDGGGARAALSEYGVFDNGFVDIAFVDRVEIAGAFAGLLYGQNSTGAVLGQVRKEPIKELRAKLFAELGGDDHHSFSLDCTGPIGESFAYRVIGAESGIEVADYLTQERWGAEGSIRTEIGDRWTAVVRAFTQTDSSDYNFAEVPDTAVTVPAPIEGATTRQFQRVELDTWFRLPDSDWAVNAKAGYGQLDLNGKASVVPEALSSFWDNVWTSSAVEVDRWDMSLRGILEQTGEVFGEEATQKVSVMAGFTNEDVNFDTAVAQILDQASKSAGGLWAVYQLDIEGDRNTSLLAAFGRSSLDYVESVAGGGSFEFETVEYSGSVGVQRAVTDVLDVFYRYSHGTSSNGGYRTADGSLLDQLETMRHEVGIKIDAFDRRLSGNLTLYQLDSENVVRHWTVLPEWTGDFLRGPAVHLDEQDRGLEGQVAWSVTRDYDLRLTFWAADREARMSDSAVLQGPALAPDLPGSDSSLVFWRAIPEGSFRLLNRYAFNDGLLKDFSIVGGYRFERIRAAGFDDSPMGTGLPFVYADLEDIHCIDLSVSYRFELFDLDWQARLGVDDVFGSAPDTVTVTAPDGSRSTYSLNTKHRFTKLSLRLDF